MQSAAGFGVAMGHNDGMKMAKIWGKEGSMEKAIAESIKNPKKGTNTFCKYINFSQVTKCDNTFNPDKFVRLLDT